MPRNVYLDQVGGTFTAACQRAGKGDRPVQELPGHESVETTPTHSQVDAETERALAKGRKRTLAFGRRTSRDVRQQQTD
jgi:hypothetical protein